MSDTAKLSSSENRTESRKVSSTEIFFKPENSKPMTPTEMTRLAAIRDEDINCSDIP